jgi:hypothetical protein
MTLNAKAAPTASTTMVISATATTFVLVEPPPAPARPAKK